MAADDDLTPELRSRYAEAIARARAARDRQAAPTAPAIGQLYRLPELTDRQLAESDARARAQRDEVAAAEARREQAAARRRLEALRMPLKAEDERALLGGTVDLDFGKSIRAVSAWIDERNAAPWLVLCGTKGRGKTLAAAWALWQRGGMYITARELERLTLTRFGEEADRFRAERNKRHLLVLDELGLEQSPGVMLGALHDLVDWRRGEGHRTIAIANLADDSLRARYVDPRLWSRLDECADFVVDRGPDMRSKRRSTP